MAGRRQDQGADTASAPAIVWFRHDLRLADQAALGAAAQNDRPVIGVFVLDRDAAGNWPHGGAQLWWLHHSLAALGKALAGHGVPLVLKRGDAATIIPELAAATGAVAVHCGATHEPWLRQLDERVQAALGERPLHHHIVSTLFDLDTIHTKTGGIYGVYTPFAAACRAKPHPAPPRGVPRLRGPGQAVPEGDRLEDWGLLPHKPDWAGGMRETWTPGEAGAHDRLRRFMDAHLGGYGQSRNIPGDPDGTSMLSPHLRWGELSPAQVWHAAEQAQEGSGGRATFHGEILWHEFAAYLLRHNPAMPDTPLRPRFARMRWHGDENEGRAWQRGRTGIPIVDAGMRQLWHTGWMHNRVRMIAASWLIKNLLTDWRKGEAWFWDTLVDGDLATNSASWQWVAGCGTDSQPFFRVFNPVTQGEKFDPDGAYVRHWVPEIAALPDRWLHRPFEAPEAVLREAGLTLDRDYPRPVIGLGEGRDRALQAFRRDVRDGAAPAPAAEKTAIDAAAPAGPRGRRAASARRAAS